MLSFRKMKANLWRCHLFDYSLSVVRDPIISREGIEERDICSFSSFRLNCDHLLFIIAAALNEQYCVRGGR